MTPCSVVVGNQRFRGSCCLHFQSGVTDAGKRANIPAWSARRRMWDLATSVTTSRIGGQVVESDHLPQVSRYH